MMAWTTCSQIDGHQTRIYNVSDSSVVALGSVGFSYSLGTTDNQKSFVNARVTITASKIFELQHRCGTTLATYGFGVAMSISTEVYSSVFIRRVA
jgi:hypothetical protein